MLTLHLCQGCTSLGHLDIGRRREADTQRQSMLPPHGIVQVTKMHPSSAGEGTCPCSSHCRARADSLTGLTAHSLPCVVFTKAAHIFLVLGFHHQHVLWGGQGARVPVDSVMAESHNAHVFPMPHCCPSQEAANCMLGWAKSGHSLAHCLLPGANACPDHFLQ